MDRVMKCFMFSNFAWNMDLAFTSDSWNMFWIPKQYSSGRGTYKQKQNE